MGYNLLYDLMVHRDNGDSFGYMCEWGEDGSSPISIESNPPDVPVTTSSGLTQAGGQFSARDSAPPYPIEINNWQDGAGQETYDKTDSSPEAYRLSYAIDATQEGHFELGPRVVHLHDYFASNKVLAALGTFWAGFTPEAQTGVAPGSLRFLHRYTMTSGSNATDYLGDTTDTSLVVTDATDLADLSISSTLDAPIPQDTSHTGPSAGHIMGDYLYCQTHNEIIHVTAVAGTTLTVERGQCGTTATAHTAGETWYGFNWTPVSFPETAPDMPLTAMTTDGEWVYAAFTDYTDNGGIWKAKAVDTAEAAVSFSTEDNVADLAWAAGYLYAAKNKGTSGTAQVGWISDAGAYTQISLTGSLSPAVTSAGLTSVANYAYWAVTDGYSHSWVYRVQHSSENTWELVAEMPEGFVATCCKGHLGSLYVGGYIDTLATNTEDESMRRYEGAMYIIGEDNSAIRAVKLANLYDGNAPDSRIKGMCSSGPYIYILTNEDVYVYDSQHGGWSHLAAVSTTTVTGYTPEVDWTTNGFTFDGNNQPTDSNAIVTDYASWDTDTDGWDETCAAVTRGTYSESSYTPIRHTMSPGGYRTWSLDNLPTDSATIEFYADLMQSQAGMVILANSTKETLLLLKGAYTGGVVTAYVAYLGYMAAADDDRDAYLWKATGNLTPVAHKFRVTLSSAGAKVYIDDALSLSASNDELRNVSGADASRVLWSVGWPYHIQTDTHQEKIRFYDMYFTSDGAYPPDYIGGTLTTTGLKDIAALNGSIFVPVPGNGTSTGGFDYINTKESVHYGHLQTSDSAYHMGSVEKYFTSITVEHSPLLSGQSIFVLPIVDDVSTGGAYGTEGDKVTVVPVSSSGRKMRISVTLGDSDYDRTFSDRLRVFRITTRFFPSNAPTATTFYLNCREGVQTRAGRETPYDPEESIRHMFAAAESGELVDVENLWTSDEENGRQRARIESAKLYQGPGDKVRYDKLTGTIMVKLRKYDG